MRDIINKEKDSIYSSVQRTMALTVIELNELHGEYASSQRLFRNGTRIGTRLQFAKLGNLRGAAKDSAALRRSMSIWPIGE